MAFDLTIATVSSAGGDSVGVMRGDIVGVRKPTGFMTPSEQVGTVLVRVTGASTASAQWLNNPWAPKIGLTVDSWDSATATGLITASSTLVDSSGRGALTRERLEPTALDWNCSVDSTGQNAVTMAMDTAQMLTSLGFWGAKAGDLDSMTMSSTYEGSGVHHLTVQVGEYPASAVQRRATDRGGTLVSWDQVTETAVIEFTQSDVTAEFQSALEKVARWTERYRRYSLPENAVSAAESAWDGQGGFYSVTITQLQNALIDKVAE